MMEDKIDRLKYPMIGILLFKITFGCLLVGYIMPEFKYTFVDYITSTFEMGFIFYGMFHMTKKFYKWLKEKID